jgi:hypothetical protein
VAPIEEKSIQHRFRWFGHAQRRRPEAPVHSGVLERVDNVKRGRGRHKLTWDETFKGDLMEWNISKELAMDMSAWRLAINMPEPLNHDLHCFFFLCLPLTLPAILCFFVILLPLFLLGFISSLP